MKSLLILALLAWPAALSADSGALTVYDKSGNLITIGGGGADGGSGSAITIASSNRFGQINWRVVHHDNHVENAYAATVDASGGIYIAGGRVWQGNNYFWLMKVSPRGEFLWETAVHGWAGCYAFWVGANAQGSAWTAGACKQPSAFPMMVVRFDPYGGTMWSQRFSEGARNYVRAMSLDFLNHVSLIMEVGQGNYAGAANQMRTVVYDQSGTQVALY